MPNAFASGKNAIAECDRCGQRYKLKELKKLTIKQTQKNIKVCPDLLGTRSTAVKFRNVSSR